MQLSFVGPKVGVNLLFIHDLIVEPTERHDADCFKVRIIQPSPIFIPYYCLKFSSRSSKLNSSDLHIFFNDFSLGGSKWAGVFTTVFSSFNSMFHARVGVIKIQFS